MEGRERRKDLVDRMERVWLVHWCAWIYVALWRTYIEKSTKEASYDLSGQMRGFHDLLGQKPSTLFILLGWGSFSIASLMISIYLGLVERMLVLSSCMECPKLMLCPTMSDLSRLHGINHWCT
jgi:hypothetical protein